MHLLVLVHTAGLRCCQCDMAQAAAARQQLEWCNCRRQIFTASIAARHIMLVVVVVRVWFYG